ncbi:hypothetical protein APR12_000276 [Nocardia amikacinitolerans]|uniref:hypothetical protein n=1 Tax=Nocardia amikacinitolerans TaxID=756689 RepID=UPI000B257DC9|nr:hypothetical protein [Nocardia amikacinitolerans]MCP2314946.1 hypothetical protein [Nocardia amikacinitolerans]
MITTTDRVIDRCVTVNRPHEPAAVGSGWTSTSDDRAGDFGVHHRPATRPCPEQRRLLEAIRVAAGHLASAPGYTDEERRRAQALLADAVAHSRSAAEIFDIDPTLTDESSLTGHHVDLLIELLGQLPAKLDAACPEPSDPRRTHGAAALAQQWAEAIALASAIRARVSQMLQELPRPDWNSPDGQHRISRQRLARNVALIAEAVELLRAAVGDAVAVDVPHPQARAIGRLVDTLDTLVEDLRAENPH